MLETTNAYAEYRRVYAEGMAALEAVRVHPKQDGSESQRERARIAATDAARRLAETEFGRSLADDGIFQGALDTLEGGLGCWFDAADRKGCIRDDDPVRGWVAEDCYEAERALRYWGGLGAIFHYFRDRPVVFDGPLEERLRAQHQADARAFTDHLASLTGHVAIHLIYKPAVVTRMKALLVALRDLEGEMQDPIGEPTLVRSGATIIRRQFARAISLLCFELFGHVAPSMICRFLDLKSTTAEALNLIPWPQTQARGPKAAASQLREVRRYVGYAVDSGRSRANRGKWVTRPILEYWATNRTEQHCESPDLY